MPATSATADRLVAVRRLLAALTFGVLSVSGYAQTAAPSRAPAREPPEYRIGAGDVLQLFVWREPDLSRELTVRTDGRVTVPLLGEVHAAGRAPSDLAQELTRLLEKFLTAPQVTVGILRANAARFFVLGQVARPGEFALTEGTTVLQALAMAGGFRDFAKTDSILIVRVEGAPSGGQPVQRFVPFNYKRLESGRDASQNGLIRAGDTILVP